MTAGVSLGAIITPPILYLASSRVGWMYTARVRLAGRADTVRRDDDVHVLIVRTVAISMSISLVSIVWRV